MIGFRIANLLIPDDPEELEIQTRSGCWTLRQNNQFLENKQAIYQGKCAETYDATHPVSFDREKSSGLDQAQNELLPLCLGMSYLTGHSCNPSRSVLSSEIDFLCRSDRYPRDRSLPGSQPAISTSIEFKQVLESFVHQYPLIAQQEKLLLIIHHWLDSLACWSLEDLYLGASTVLQIIAATEADRQQKKALFFYNSITAVAARWSLTRLSEDFKKMRNDLIHEGTLSGSHFSSKSKSNCAAVVTEALNWIDTYLHTVLCLGAVRRIRFDANEIAQLNSFSL